MRACARFRVRACVIRITIYVQYNSLMYFLADIRLDDTTKIMSTLPSVTPIRGQATTNLGGGLATPSSPASSNMPSMSSVGTQSNGAYVQGTSGGSLLGSVVGGLFNLGTAFLNRKWAKKDYQQQRMDAKADYKTQLSDYWKMVMDEREYNSPAAQRARLLQAGINPNTVFGNGSVENTSSTAQSPSPVRGSDLPSSRVGSLGSEMVDMIAPIMNSSLMQLQAENLRKDQAVKTAQIAKILSEVKGIDASTKGQLIQNGWYSALNAATVKERNASASKYLDDMQTSAVNRMFTDYQLKHMAPAQVANIQAATSKLFAEVRSIVQSIDYLDSVKSTRQRSEFLQLKRDAVDYALAKFEKEAFENNPVKKTDGYHNFMKEVQFFTNSLLGWWAGAGHLIPSSKPKNIGFK